MKLDTDVSKIVSEPILRSAYTPMQSRLNAAIFQQTVQPFITPQPPAPSTSIFPSCAAMPNRPPPLNMLAPQGADIICYGCGEKGHGMSSCSAINELMINGLI
jgi:hypothetical protein